MTNVFRYARPMSPDTDSTAVLDRGDQRALRVLVRVVAGLTVLAYVVAPVLAWVTGGSLTRLVDLPDASGSRGLRPGARLGDTQGEVELLRPSAGVRLLDLLPGLLIAGGVVVAAWAVLRVLRSFGRGRTFSTAAATGLRILGVLLVFLPIAVGLANGVTDAVFTDQALRPSGDVDFSLTFDLGLLPITLVSGLFVIALGEAFARGRRMEDDLEGLV